MRRITTLAAVSAATLFATNAARGNMVLALSDGTTDLVLVDQGGVGAVSSSGIISSFPDLDPTLGAISYSGPVGSFSLAVAVGVSKPLLGPPPSIDLFSLTVSSGSGTLLVAASDDGYTSVDPAAGEIFTFGGATDGSVSLSSYVDPDDLEFSTDDGRLAGILDGAGASIEMGNGNEQSIQTGPLGPGAFDGEILKGFSLPAPYTMTLVAEITHSALGQTTSLNAKQTISPIPEANSIVIWIVIWGVFVLRFTRLVRV